MVTFRQQQPAIAESGHLRGNYKPYSQLAVTTTGFYNNAIIRYNPLQEESAISLSVIVLPDCLPVIYIFISAYWNIYYYKKR